MIVHYLLPILQIILIDILLGGDNAIVIALACRKLPMAQRDRAIAWGAFGAIFLRTWLIFFALQLLLLPYVQILSAMLLMWIGIKLMRQDDDDAINVRGSTTLIGAIQTIIVADAIMSLDNVIAVAGAAGGRLGLVIFGIVVSIPTIIYASRFLVRAMDRFPIIISAGAGILGSIAGNMLMEDAVVRPYVTDVAWWFPYLLSFLCASLVVLVGSGMREPRRA